MTSKQPILKVINLKKYFKVSQGTVHAVDDISFEIYEGETFGLVGESGSGKSTTGYIIMGFYTPTSGKILYKGKDISMPVTNRPLSLKKEIQIVFQDPGTSLNPKHTIKEILELPLKLHGIATTKEELENEIAKLLQLVELPEDYMYRYPRELGGGERQLVAIARALAPKPRFILLDEPTSALDVSVQAKIISKLFELQKMFNLTYLFITHDLSLMRNVAHRVAIMYLGKIYEIAKTEDFFKNPQHPYTKMLLSSIPVVSKEEEELKPKEIQSTGEIPSPLKPPKGCRFHTRCPFATEKCRTNPPPLRETEEKHYVACWLYH